MTIALLAIMLTIIVALAMGCATAYGNNSMLRTMLRQKNRDYDDIMARALKAETDFTYLKETIGVMLQRPVLAQLSSEQVQLIAKSIALAAMQAVPSDPVLKN